MHPVHHTLAAWLLAVESGKPIDAIVRAKLLAEGAGSLRADQALTIMREGCPDVMALTGGHMSYFGGRCAYKSRFRCLGSRGCTTPVTIGNITLSTPLVGAGSLELEDPEYALKMVQKFEAKTGKRVNIVVVNGGLHYLHLYPARKFENKCGALLGQIREAMNALMAVLRAHLEPTGLVVWKTTNDICDAKYDANYKKTLSDLHKAGAFEYRQANESDAKS
jgi:hypothetical protein